MQHQEEELNHKPKTNAKQRQLVITVNYHYRTAGRRPKLRSDIAGAVLRAVTRRLEREGHIVVDGITHKEREL